MANATTATPIREPDLTLDGFRTWLESLPAGMVLGDRRDCYTCPLAQWIDDQGFDVRVTRGQCGVAPHAGLFSKATWRDLPLWAQRFIHMVDAGQGQRIQAGECLLLLKEVSRG